MKAVVIVILCSLMLTGAAFAKKGKSNQLTSAELAHLAYMALPKDYQDGNLASFVSLRKVDSSTISRELSKSMIALAEQGKQSKMAIIIPNQRRANKVMLNALGLVKGHDFKGVSFVFVGTVEGKENILQAADELDLEFYFADSGK